MRLAAAALASSAGTTASTATAKPATAPAPAGTATTTAAPSGCATATGATTATAATAWTATAWAPAAATSTGLTATSTRPAAAATHTATATTGTATATTAASAAGPAPLIVHGLPHGGEVRARRYGTPSGSAPRPMITICRACAAPHSRTRRGRPSHSLDDCAMVRSLVSTATYVQPQIFLQQLAPTVFPEQWRERCAWLGLFAPTVGRT